MGLPDPIEPQSGDVPAPAQGEGRADWLCGPEEGIEAEIHRRQRESEGHLPAPKLSRPDAAPSSPEPELRLVGGDPFEGAPAPPPRLTRPAPPPEEIPHGSPSSTFAAPPAAAPRAEAPDDAVASAPGMSWAPGANSVPVLRRDTSPPPLALVPPLRAAAPASPMDFPMDDAEERARAVEVAAAAAAAAAERAAQPHAVVAPDSFDLTSAPAPWWMQVPVLLREDRRVQALAGLVVVLLLSIALWPRPEKTLSLGAIRRDPSHFDGQDVKVSGKVGEVFEVGGGYAFYLHQGRDTLVVFTRSRTPRRGAGVTVAGTMSTGYLNGQAGTALFESVATK
jgi:hypothetical protein